MNVVVSGASRGTGAACARAFAARGARVALIARSERALRALADEIGAGAVVVVADLAEEAAADAVAAAVDTAFDGRLDVLVNNAGMVLNRRSERLDGSQIDKVIGLNLRSVLLLSGRLGHALRAARGNIVSVSSVTGIVGLPFSAAYAASKSGVDGMTRALAAEWGPFGVRVNAVVNSVFHWYSPAGSRSTEEIAELLADFAVAGAAGARRLDVEQVEARRDRTRQQRVAGPG